MSEFSEHKNARVDRLFHLFEAIRKGGNISALVRENQNFIDNCVPSDVISLVDRLVLEKIPMDEMKRGINKLLNLLYKTISEYPYSPPDKQSFFGYLAENNRIMEERLQQLRPVIREINQHPDNLGLKTSIRLKFSELEKFSQLYQIKENVLFPVIEKSIPDYRCLSVMWSFHDDTRRNLKNIQAELSAATFDLAKFNRWCGDLFFNMYAIKFREERILYPRVQEVVPGDVLNNLFSQSLEIGFPFFQPEIIPEYKEQSSFSANEIDLTTGNLSVEQIRLLFNHLPVDITFVDENNRVKYFSTPKKRIFPRTKAIIGRDVHNCHPPESVHVVEEIVETFRNGKKDSASFWINMKGQKLLIQYFAIRDENGTYKGVVEVSQEISEIQRLQGEKRLLDWE